MLSPSEKIQTRTAGMPLGNADSMGRGSRNTVNPTELLWKSQSLQATLLESLGGDCKLVARGDHGWQLILRSHAATPTLERVPAELALVLDNHFDRQKTACVAEERGAQFVIVPIPNCGTTHCARLPNADAC